jgi:starch phosphorylase
MEQLLPRHMQLIFEINQRFLRRVATQWPGDSDKLSALSVIEESQPKQVRMAHLATVGSHSVNGVAQLHTELVKRDLFADFCQMMPERFNNKTNGVSPRRWMLYSNPRLTHLISSRIGNDWIDKDLRLLRQVGSLATEKPFLEALASVKRANKRDLAVLVRRLTGVELPPEAMYVVQVKRIHEYKRQLLACLQVISLYLEMKRNPDADFTPRAYLFAGKAAAGYTMAKLHIKLLNDVASVINSDPVVQGRLAMAFLPNYGVSLAQCIVPGDDLSVQISTAGKEASGTSNMKFALNGSLTIGTLDGANVEILEHVGEDNIFIFGNTTSQVVDIRARGYQPRTIYDADPALKAALDAIRDGTFSPLEPGRYQQVFEVLVNWGDHYLLLADYASYIDTQHRVDALYRNADDWTRRALLNVAAMGVFSSDRTITEYADTIWHTKPVMLD